MRRLVLTTTLYASLLTLPVASPANAATLLLDFESFANGQVLQPGALGNGITMQLDPHDDDEVPVVFNSSCVHSQCAPGFDDDLETPGQGHGNTVALNNILALEEEDDYRRSPGGSHSSDDQEDTWVFIFDPPLKVLGLTVINVEHGDSGSRIELRGPGQQLQLIPLALLGENSVQRVSVIDPFLATSMVLVLDDDAAIDDLFVTDGCGDGILDPGEQCDDGNDDDGDCCSKSCEIQGNGTTCDDGNPATTSDVCSAGTCEGVDLCAGVTCTALDYCHLAGSCEPLTGLCRDPEAPDGTACDDGDPVTVNDSCTTGSCEGVDLCVGVACTAIDECHLAGACSPLTGLCTNPEAPNGIPCDDGDPVTVFDSCDDGTCEGVDLCVGVACTAIDQCHVAGTCDPLTGTCDNPDAANGTPCDDADPVTSSDTCTDGTCEGVDLCASVDCSGLEGACTTAACDYTTGACVVTPINEGGACDDGSVCTTVDTCSSGSCLGASPISCDDTNPCTDDGCDAITGCTFTNNSIPCVDGFDCTTDDNCLNGACQGTPQIASCEDNNPCTIDACDIASGCIYATNTSGTCNDGDLCTENDICVAGTCQSGDTVTCNDSNQCTTDSCVPATGCSYVDDDSAPCDDADECTSGESCSAGVCGGSSVVTCDDTNGCTDETCIPTTGCNYTDNTNPCNDGDACTTSDTCSAGACVGGVAPDCNDFEVCTDDSCVPATGCEYADNTANCDDTNECTTGDTCSAGACVSGPAPNCDDSNVCTTDACDPTTGCVNAANSLPCEDGLFCNGTDTCSASECGHTGDPCTGLLECNDQCNDVSDDCLSVTSVPCDDGDICTPDDTCDGAGICVPTGTSCGDGVLQGSCAEECDPPDGTTCDVDCTLLPYCGDGTVDPDEFCDDGNDQADDGCFDCGLESGELFCFEGNSANPSRKSNEIVFESAADYSGNNPDGNIEIFVFSRKEYDKQIRQGTDPTVALSAAMTQITDTTSLVFGVDNNNENPTLNGSGRFVAFSSNSDLTGSNPDGNTEVFHLDRRRDRLLQISQSVGASNNHPNMRATRARRLLFDSDGDLVNSCVGGDNDRNSCGSDADCPGLVCDDPARCPDAPAKCGNPEGNREIFMWKRELVGPTAPAPIPGLQQLTAAESGISVVGHSVNFNSAAIPFSSTADLLATNPPGTEGERSLYRIQRKATQLVQVTTPYPSGFFSESPSQSRKRFIAFASDADLVPGSNSDGNVEIFLWDANLLSSPYTQVTNTAGCTNAMPSVGAIARFIAFQSTCDLLGNGSNSGQSIFLYDRDKDGFASGIVLKGPGGYDASRPQVSRIVRVIIFEADPGGMAPQQVCVFNVRKGLFEGSTVPAKP